MTCILSDPLGTLKWHGYDAHGSDHFLITNWFFFWGQSRIEVNLWLLICSEIGNIIKYQGLSDTYQILCF